MIRYLLASTFAILGLSLAAGCTDTGDADDDVSETEQPLIINDFSTFCSGGIAGDGQCPPDQYCHKSGVCRDDRVEGDYCVRDAQCETGRCVNNACYEIIDPTGGSSSGGCVKGLSCEVN